MSTNEIGGPSQLSNGVNNGTEKAGGVVVSGGGGQKKPCKNDPSGQYTYTGKEYSPLGLGETAALYEPGTIRTGRDTTKWQVQKKNKVNVWVRIQTEDGAENVEVKKDDDNKEVVSEEVPKEEEKPKKKAPAKPKKPTKKQIEESVLAKEIVAPGQVQEPDKVEDKVDEENLDKVVEPEPVKKEKKPRATKKTKESVAVVEQDVESKVVAPVAEPEVKEGKPKKKATTAKKTKKEAETVPAIEVKEEAKEKRKPNAYNLFVKIQMADPSMKDLPHRDKMTTIGVVWKGMSKEEQDKFKADHASELA